MAYPTKKTKNKVAKTAKKKVAKPTKTIARIGWEPPSDKRPLPRLSPSDLQVIQKARGRLGDGQFEFVIMELPDPIDQFRIPGRGKFYSFPVAPAGSPWTSHPCVKRIKKLGTPLIIRPKR